MPVIPEQRSLHRQLSHAGRHLFRVSLGEHTPEPPYSSGSFPLPVLLRACEASGVRLQVTPTLTPALSTTALEQLFGNRLELVIAGNGYRLRLEVGAVEITMLVQGQVQYTWVTTEDGRTEQWSSWLARANAAASGRGGPGPGPSVEDLRSLQSVLSLLRLLDLSDISAVASRAEPSGPSPTPRGPPTLHGGDLSMQSAASDVSSFDGGMGGGGGGGGGVGGQQVQSLSYCDGEEDDGARIYTFKVRSRDGKLLR